MEISNRPVARTDSRHAETSAPPDLCCAHKVHLRRATRAVRNASATVHPATLSARKASPVRRRAELKVHHRESRQAPPRLASVHSTSPFLLTTHDRCSVTTFAITTTA